MSKSVVEVLSHHMTCVARGDVAGIMEDYTDTSVLFSPDGIADGRATIERFFSALTSSMMPPGTLFQPVRQDVRGDTAFLMWQADSPTMKFHMGAETLVIRDGKIVTHSFAAAIEQKG